MMKTYAGAATFAAAALALSIALPGAAHAAPIIDKGLTINVYQLCDDAGFNCASLGPADDNFYAAETSKIWAQAGISVSFNFVGTINNSLFLTVDDGGPNSFFNLAGLTGNRQSTTILDMFLVSTVVGAYGEGWDGVGGLVMGMDDIMGYPGPRGRIDTMAHELGHNLGLVPDTDPEYAGPSDPGHSSDPNQLMASGAIRNVPLTLDDINPDGLGYDQLSPFQIALARESTLLYDLPSSVVPEPGTLSLLLGGLGMMALRRRPASRA